MTDLAVSAQPLHHLRKTGERLRQLRDPLRQPRALARILQDGRKKLEIRAHAEVTRPTADVLAEEPVAEVVVADATDRFGQREVVGIPEVGLAETELFADAYGADGAPLGVLVRFAERQVRGERQRRDELGQADPGSVARGARGILVSEPRADFND